MEKLEKNDIPGFDRALGECLEALEEKGLGNGVDKPVTIVLSSDGRKDRKNNYMVNATVFIDGTPEEVVDDLKTLVNG